MTLRPCMRERSRLTEWAQMEMSRSRRHRRGSSRRGGHAIGGVAGVGQVVVGHHTPHASSDAAGAAGMALVGGAAGDLERPQTQGAIAAHSVYLLRFQVC